MSQEYHVLGSQPLTELRDKIVCRSDHMVPGEVSQFPDLPIDVTTKVQWGKPHNVYTTAYLNFIAAAWIVLPVQIFLICNGPTNSS